MEQTLLTRESILSGAYFDAFADLPAGIVWTPEKIRSSINETLRNRPTTGAFWLFAYGSLLWNPLFEIADRQLATLHGWHRSFCLRVKGGRGSADRPGRMLSLEAGSATTGVALLLPEEKLDEELLVIWTREMITGAYCPTWVEARFSDGRRVEVFAFLANPLHPSHDSQTGVQRVALEIANAHGPLGSNAEYVFRLREALDGLGVKDEYIEAVATGLDQLLPLTSGEKEEMRA
ncbi:gamma-glutamylcyclotransferase [Paraburkholderia xenovorans]|uniref:gamma-glutamylcyclotransferase n=1 Tax=Paraburkholderia xenovorans TaxID=36873 RepID=UPI0038B764F2